MSLLGNMDITQVMYGCHAQHVNGQLIFSANGPGCTGWP